MLLKVICFRRSMKKCSFLKMLRLILHGMGWDLTTQNHIDSIAAGTGQNAAFRQCSDFNSVEKGQIQLSGNYIHLEKQLFENYLKCENIQTLRKQGTATLYVRFFSIIFWLSGNFCRIPPTLILRSSAFNLKGLEQSLFLVADLILKLLFIHKARQVCFEGTHD